MWETISCLGEILTKKLWNTNSLIFKHLHNLCKIWSFHGGDYEECRLPGRWVVWHARCLRRLLVTADVVLSSWILASLMTGALLSSETLVFARATRGNITEDGIIYIICRSMALRFRTESRCSFETSVLTRATRLNIPEDCILHSHRRENIKSYIFNWVRDKT
jgi:hypothetical protein